MMPFLNSVYDGDWSQGTPYQVTQTYSAADMAIITNTSHREPIIPPTPTDRHYISPAPVAYSVTGPVTVSL